jgi:sulfur carrier protein ThiS adenylyltransferase
MTELLSDQQLVQYYRQVLLPEVEEAGQQALLQHHVMIVGVGGLGTHVAQQLGAAGIGHLHLIDDDRVELSNLPRQILFNINDVGRFKANCAEHQLSKQNPNIDVTAYPVRFSSEYANNLLNQLALGLPKLDDDAFCALINTSGYKFLTVLDCSDNIATRQAINSWCVTHGIALISAAVSGFSGQLLSITPDTLEQAGCYRCIFNEQEVAGNCASQGVLGTTVAAVASMQSAAAINHILAIQGPSALRVFDGKSLNWQTFARKRDPQCPCCSQQIVRSRAPVDNLLTSVKSKVTL